MRKEKAKKHFLGQSGHEKLNCSQAVIKAFHDAFDAPAQAVDAFAACGGGNAPQGRCGAYHAAHYLISQTDSSRAAKLEQEFLNAAGALTCSEIRRKRKITCLGCVEIAADFLEGGRE